MRSISSARVTLAVLLMIASASCASKESQTPLDPNSRLISLLLSPKTQSIRDGQITQLQVAMKRADGGTAVGVAVNWQSTKPSIAAVASDGTITGMSIGSTQIVASAESLADTATITVTTDVASVSVTPPTATLGTGATMQLSAMVKDASNNALTGRTVTWTTSDASLATVSSSGVVTAKAVGIATITATCEGTAGTATMTITAPSQAPVASVAVSLPASALSIGQTTQASAVLKDANGTVLGARTIAWSSSDTTIAAVSSSGLVSAKRVGAASISATSEGQSGSATVTVVAPVASVVVTLNPSSVTVGQTSQATAVAKDAQGNVLTGRTITWAAAPISVATVSATGLVTGNSAGTAQITATAEGVSGSATVTVTPVPVATVTVTLGSGTVSVGQTTQATALLKDAQGNVLTGRTITWSSSDTTIATVSSSGIVTGRGAGNASISAMSEGQSGSVSLTVVAPVASVAVTLNPTSVAIGQTTQATAVLKDAQGNVLTGPSITWSASPTSVATVSANGVVTAKAAGTAQITATSGGVSGSATVTVTLVPVAAVTVTLGSGSLTVGQTTQATAVAKDAAGNVLSLTGRSVTWSSGTAGVATVSTSGLVTAVAVGAASITAKVDAVSGSTSVTVAAAPPPPPPGSVPGLVDLNCPATSAPPLPSAPLRSLYVDATAGNDASDGLSTSTPWKTLAKANGAVKPGDIVYLKGTFSGGQWINPSTSGTATNKIVFTSWPGQTAVISGGDPSAGTAVYLVGHSHIVIDGLELSTLSYAVQMSSPSSNNWLRNLYVHDIGEIWMEGGASDNRIEDSRIERCGSEASNSGDCIWIANGSHRNVVARNTMRFGGHALIDIGGDKAGMASSDDNVVEQNDLANGWANNLGLLGFANRTIVECNRIHDATQQTTINYPRAGMNINASNNTVRFNLFYNNKQDGIQIQGYAYQGALFSPSGNQIYQNTFYGNGGSGLEISEQGDGVVSNTLVANNIFWNNAGRAYEGSSYAVWIDLYSANTIWPVGSLNGNVIQNNILASTSANIGKNWLMIVISTGNRTYTLSQAQSALTAISGNREVDPLLNTTDFTLQAGSPAIDAGTVILTGQKFTGAAPDLGAREKP